MTDIPFPKRPKSHRRSRELRRQHRNALQTFRVFNLHTANDQFAALDQRMNIVTNSNVNHAPL